MGHAHGRRAVGWRLAGMMFLQYFGIGAWIVPLARYLTESPARGGLGFGPTGQALVYSAWPVAAMVTPMLVAPLADRRFAAEKLLAVLQLVMAVFLTAAGAWCDAAAGGLVPAEPVVLFALMLLYAAAMLPSNPLTNVIAMRNLDDPQASFGRVRLVGTFGWIVAGVALAVLVEPISPGPLYLAAGTALVQAVYAITVLPHTPPEPDRVVRRGRLGFAAVGLFRFRWFLAFAFATLLGSMMNQFYVLRSNEFLAARGVPRTEAVLTLAQWVEMGCMAAVPLLIARLGLRAVLLAGLVGWVVRNATLALGPTWLVIGLGLPLHGFSYVYFSIVGALLVDRAAPDGMRASAQALLTFLSSGPAVLAGYWLASAAGTASGHDWSFFWLVPTVGCAVAAAAFGGLYREPAAAPHHPPADE